VCEAYLAAVNVDGADLGPIYNVGSGRQVTIADAVAVARELFGIAAEPRWGEFQQRGWDTSIWISDPAKIKRELGWQARTTFREGLERTAAWSRSSSFAGANQPGSPRATNHQPLAAS